MHWIYIFCSLSLFHFFFTEIKKDLSIFIFFIHRICVCGMIAVLSLLYLSFLKKIIFIIFSLSLNCKVDFCRRKRIAGWFKRWLHAQLTFFLFLVHLFNLIKKAWAHMYIGGKKVSFTCMLTRYSVCFSYLFFSMYIHL